MEFYYFLAHNDPALATDAALASLSVQCIVTYSFTLCVLNEICRCFTFG